MVEAILQCLKVNKYSITPYLLSIALNSHFPSLPPILLVFSHTRTLMGLNMGNRNMSNYMADLLAILIEHPSIHDLRFLNFPPTRQDQKTNTLTRLHTASVTESYRTLSEVLARNASRRPLSIYDHTPTFLFPLPPSPSIPLLGLSTHAVERSDPSVLIEEFIANSGEALLISKQMLGGMQLQGKNLLVERFFWIIYLFSQHSNYLFGRLPSRGSIEETRE